MQTVIIFCIIACLIIGILIFLLFKQNKELKEIISINREREEYNQQLEKNIILLEFKLVKIDLAFKAKTEELSKLTASVDATASLYEDIARKRAEDEYKAKISSLEEDYQKRVQQIDNDTRNKLLDYKLVLSKIQELQAKLLAYVQMKLREEEIATLQDYYRLVISDADNSDVKFLREAQARLSHKEAIDKVIWDVYYKPAYDILMSHLFNKSNKICGICRITCIINGKAYIGLSVDIKERFRLHIKNALTYTSTSNKLYQEMKNKGIDNFTFEILERMPREQLNEREVYWIDFCKTKDFGLNGTKGNVGQK